MTKNKLKLPVAEFFSSLSSLHSWHSHALNFIPQLLLLLVEFTLTPGSNDWSLDWRVEKNTCITCLCTLVFSFIAALLHQVFSEGLSVDCFKTEIDIKHTKVLIEIGDKIAEIQIKIRGQMSEYQFVDSLTSCFGQRGDGSVLSADYYSPQAYNSCYGSASVTSNQAGPGPASPVTTSYSDPGYLHHNGGDHHHATHHGLNSTAYTTAATAAAVCSGQSNRLSHHQTASQVPPSLSTSAPQSYPHAQYKYEFPGENVTTGHQDMVSALSDCAMRTVASVQTPSSQYPYLEPSLLSRRNGSINSYGDSFPDCSQINGSSPYHLNHHLATQLHHHHHHQHHQSRTLGNSATAAAPVPTYKWMQVKRNVPKPGKS